jgi:hypothetical protein
MKRIRVMRCLAACLAVAILCGHGAGVALAKEPGTILGFVDGSEFVDLAGEEGGLVEISISRTILNALCRGFAGGDNEITELICNINGIEAVIVDTNGNRERALKLIRGKESTLRKRGWERLVLIREAGSHVSVLILTDKQDRVRGLVVMATEEGEVVFTNISGIIDLALIQRLGSQFEIPGLEHVETED